MVKRMRWALLLARVQVEEWDRLEACKGIKFSIGFVHILTEQANIEKAEIRNIPTVMSW